MSMSRFDNIRVVLADPNPVLRSELLDSLNVFGIRNVTPTGNMSDVARSIREGQADLVIADTVLPEGNLNTLISEMRFGHEGANPFLVVITMVSEPNRQAVHAAINSGADHVLAKPFAPDELVKRIQELTHTRKRFVATADYIGPDRRTKRRPGTMDVPLIDVPNPLHHRMSEHISTNHERRMIDSAKQRINEFMVQRQAYQIGWMLEDALPLLSRGLTVENTELAETLSKLSCVASDISTRLKGTSFAHGAEVCMTLDRMTSLALTQGLSKADVELMTRMGDILSSMFDPNRQEIALNYGRRARALNVFEAEPGSDAGKAEPAETAPALGDAGLESMVLPKALAGQSVN